MTSVSLQLVADRLLQLTYTDIEQLQASTNFYLADIGAAVPRSHALAEALLMFAREVKDQERSRETQRAIARQKAVA